MKKTTFVWNKVYTHLSLDEYIDHLISIGHQIVQVIPSGFNTGTGEINRAIILALDKK